MYLKSLSSGALKQLYRKPSALCPLLRSAYLPPSLGGTCSLRLLSAFRARNLTTTAAATDTLTAEDAPSEPLPLDSQATLTNASAPGNPFAELGVDERLLVNLPSLKVNEPSPIQSSAIPLILKGGNCAVQSYTGSGKTLAYLLPTMTRVLQAIEQQPDSEPVVRALVVAPSQELCMQIVNVAKALLPPEARGAVQQCIGGANPKRQLEALKKNKPAIVVGTPGRLASLGRDAKLMVHNCNMLVIDEADQLLSDSFISDLNWIVEHTGKRAAGGRQTVLVSATLTRSLLQKTSQMCPNPEYISIGSAPHTEAPAPHSSSGGESEQQAPIFGWGAKGWGGPASSFRPKTEGSIGGVEGEELVPAMPPNLRHVFLVAPQRHRVDMLRRAVHALGVQKALVFMNFQQRLKDTQFKLESRSMEVANLHGDLSKLERANVLRKFRDGDYRMLIVSDVLARGLDIAECDAVFNLEMPSNAAHYAHRAGRTGRMGAAGTVVSLVDPTERWVVEKLAKKLQVPILEVNVEGGEVKLGALAPASPSKTKKKSDDAQDKVPSTSGTTVGARASRAGSAGNSETPEGKADQSASSKSAKRDRDTGDKQKAGKGRSGRNARGEEEEEGRTGQSRAGGAVSTSREDSQGGRIKGGRRQGRSSRDGEEEEAWGRETWHPQQKAKIEKFFRKANVDLKEVLEISDDDDDDEWDGGDEEKVGGRKGKTTRTGADKAKKLKEEVAAELAEIKQEKRKIGVAGPGMRKGSRGGKR